MKSVGNGQGNCSANSKYDLVRWGIWFRYTLQYNTYTDVQENIRRCHEYYPIPDQQVVASGYQLNNDEYKKYGL